MPGTTGREANASDAAMEAAMLSVLQSVLAAGTQGYRQFLESFETLDVADADVPEPLPIVAAAARLEAVTSHGDGLNEHTRRKLLAFVAEERARTLRLAAAESEALEEICAEEESAQRTGGFLLSSGVRAPKLDNFIEGEDEGMGSDGESPCGSPREYRPSRLPATDSTDKPVATLGGWGGAVLQSASAEGAFTEHIVPRTTVAMESAVRVPPATDLYDLLGEVSDEEDASAPEAVHESRGGSNGDAAGDEGGHRAEWQNDEADETSRPDASAAPPQHTPGDREWTPPEHRIDDDDDGAETAAPHPRATGARDYAAMYAAEIRALLEEERARGEIDPTPTFDGVEAFSLDDDFDYDSVQCAPREFPYGLPMQRSPT